MYDPPVRFKDGTLVERIPPFIPEIPRSVFGQNPYPRFFSEWGFGWIVVLPGPDGDFDIELDGKTTSALETFWRSGDPTTPPSSLVDKTYDPTNGAYDGDMVLTRWRGLGW